MAMLAKRYARALFEVAEAQGATEAVAADLTRIAMALEDATVRAIVFDPQRPRLSRQQALAKLAAGGHPLTLSLLQTLLRHRRETLLQKLPLELAAYQRRQRGELDGVVETALPIDENERARLEQVAAEFMGKKVTLRVAVNAELIGGVRIRVGNTLYDGSVATSLEELERRLMELPVA